MSTRTIYDGYEQRGCDREYGEHGQILSQPLSGVRRPASALLQRLVTTSAAVVRHGSDVPFTSDDWFWASPSICFPFQELEGVAQLKSKTRLRQGRAMPHNSWQSRVKLDLLPVFETNYRTQRFSVLTCNHSPFVRCSDEDAPCILPRCHIVHIHLLSVCLGTKPDR